MGILLSLVFYILILAVAVFILTHSSQFLITAITRLGHHLGMSQFLTGFILLGFATSIPEIFIAVNSVLSNTPQLSLGNLFGATVVLLSLIAGGTAWLNRGVVIRPDLHQLQRLVQISALILAPLVLLLDLQLTRLDGFFLAFLYIVYLLYIFRLRPENSPPLTESLLNHKILHTAVLSGTGLLGVILSSRAIVFASLNLSSLFRVPPVSVGILILSVGTNLPEISVAFAAIRKKESSLVIGDILGSAATNTLIISALALVRPFAISEWAIFETTAVFMVISLSVFIYSIRSKFRLSDSEGMVLFSIYIAFVVSEILSLLIR